MCNNLDSIIALLQLKKSDILFANPYFQRQTTRHSALQIDYLLHCKQDTVYICEVKFSKHAVDTSIIEEMQNKARKLALPKHISIRFVLIHVNGVNEHVHDAQFFQHIIDFGELLTTPNV